ncbi:EAL and HDOD domain-containing protein [Balneatrix alpica]|uniref:EAL and HDOD domain-containing protein n=1 Tax=Balneatrix alpica TaxID=75684 RepID=A0ABV5Z9Z7_9GAMM|nr:HDOD domain-containing protein [Balneatrix alpica]
MECVTRRDLLQQLSGDECFFIARQPVYDAKLNIVGYELLYRSQCEQQANFTCGNQATASVLGISLTEMGIPELVGPHLAFINMTRWALLSAQVMLLPPQKVVLEILEDVEVDEVLLNRLQQLKQAGYRLALDDYALQPGKEALIALSSLIKLDVRQLSSTQVRQLVRYFKGQGRQVLVEKVETWDEMELYRQEGADYFQGYFLAKPQLLCGRKAPYNHRVTLELLQRLYDPEIGMRELTELISQDVFLCYRLLRYLNSAASGLSVKVSSIQHAIVMLGLEPLRALVTLLSLMKDGQHPPALVHLLLVRARFCQLSAPLFKLREQPSSLFTVGMLSMLDVFLAKPLPQLLQQLPLQPELIRAVLERQGEMGQILQLAEALQNGKPLTRVGVDAEQVQQCYQQAFVWATLSMAQLGSV